MTKIYPRPASVLREHFSRSAPSASYEAAQIILQDTIPRHAVKADSGAVFFAAGRYGSEWYCLPPNSDKAYKLQDAGFSGSSVSFKVSFHDDLLAEEGRHSDTQLIYKNGQGVFLNGVLDINLIADLPLAEKAELALKLAAQDIVCVDLPEKRKLESVFRAPDGDHILVSVNATNYQYETFRLFKGPLDNLKEIPVQNVSRYRDGGTTYIKTDEGTLYQPTPFNKTLKPTWNDAEVETLDVKNISVELGQKAPRAQGIKIYSTVPLRPFPQN